MLDPSHSMEIIATFFSVFRMVAISSLIVDLSYDVKYDPSTIICVIHKVFMKTKMGRPKVPKAKLRGILVQARLSPEEYRPIAEAVRRSGLSESEWVRKTLLSAT